MTNYPLSWPAGWKRTPSHKRKEAKFNKKVWRPGANGTGGYYRSGEVSIHQATERVMQELSSFGVRGGIQNGNIIISSNLKLRNDGLPISGQKEPGDPGIAVYWKRPNDTTHKVMGIDQYDRVADNLAAMAATLNAMRAIERHGSAAILERAFVGFSALPAPNTWKAVLSFGEGGSPDIDEVMNRYRQLCKKHHPDVGGSESKMQELNWAMQEAEKELCLIGYDNLSHSQHAANRRIK